MMGEGTEVSVERGVFLKVFYESSSENETVDDAHEDANSIRDQDGAADFTTRLEGRAELDNSSSAQGSSREQMSFDSDESQGSGPRRGCVYSGGGSIVGRGLQRLQGSTRIHLRVRRRMVAGHG